MPDQETIQLVHRGPNQPKMTIDEIIEEVVRLDVKLNLSEHYENKLDVKLNLSEHYENKLKGEVEALEMLREVTVKDYDRLKGECAKLKEDNRAASTPIGICSTAAGGSNPIGVCVEDVKKGDPALFDVKTGELRPDWESMADKWKEFSKRQEAELKRLREATGGHSIENLNEFMKALPSAESVEGYTLEYRLPPNEGCAWGTAGRVWQTLFLIRTPKVEYIEDDDITDEMVRANGWRVPCEGKDGEGEEWKEDTLYEVDRSIGFPFRCKKEIWNHCRIKKSDI